MLTYILNTMNKIKILIVVALSLNIMSCYNDKEEKLYPNSFGACDTTKLTYTNGISTIVNTNCAISGCHAAGGTFPQLNTYELLIANIDRVKARAIDSKNMPAPSGMSSCNISKLQHWIDIGKPKQ